MIITSNNIENIPAEARGAVLAIGNFDGVHLGHRALIFKARELANRAEAPLAVLTFEPHPRNFFEPLADPFRLTLPPMKTRLLEGIGVRYLFSLPFNAALAEMEAQAFIDWMLVGRLHVKHIVVGENFAFGKKKAGTAKTLEEAAAAGKFAFTALKTVHTPEGGIYSSSVIRILLREGRIREAHKLLGWPWQIEATIVEGDKRGRTLGFPTANQDVPDYVRIPFGIYAVRMQIEGENRWRDGVASFGVRPMFAVARPLFETHIFDFDADIYGKTMRVQPVQYLRSELAFLDTKALIAQMEDDCIKAKAVLKSNQTFQT